MSGQHTQGRLEAADISGNGELGLVVNKRESILSVDDSNFAYVFNPEDARRLAACWNACIAVSTETLEAMPKGVMPYMAGKDRQSAKLMDQLGAASALLSEVIGIHDAACDHDLKGIFVDEFSDRIRAFLKGQP